MDGKVRPLGDKPALLGDVWPRVDERLLIRDERAFHSADRSLLFDAGSVRIDNPPVGDRLLRAENGLALMLGEGSRLLGDRLGLFDDTLPRAKLLPAEN